MSKRIIALLLSVIATCLLFCCDGGSGDSSSKPDSGKTSDTGDSSEIKEETTLQNLLGSMTGGIYKDDTLYANGYGLSNPADVGVDKELFENEVRYAVEGDENFSSDALFVVDKKDGVVGLRLALEQAKKVNATGKKVKIKLPEGEFILSMENLSAAETYFLHIEDFDGLYIEGNNTVLVMDNDGSQWVGFIEFSHCKNVYMQDVALDYAVPPVLAGRLSAIDAENGKAEVELNEEFLPAWGEKGKLLLKSYVEIGENKAPYPGGNYYYDSGDAQGIESCDFKNGKAYIAFRSSVSATPVGTLVSLAVTMYGNNAINFNECRNAHLETVRVYSCPGMGITAMKCENLYWNRTNVMLKPGSARLMTATADAMHLTTCTGDVFISNSIIENTHDDGMNIKAGFYMSVVSVAYNTGKVVIDGYNDENLPPKVGDKIEIYTPALEYVTSLTVSSVRASAGKYEILPEEYIDDVQSGMYAVNVSCTPKFIYENNVIRNKRNRGMLIQVRGAVVRNCSFLNIAHGALNVYTELATTAREAMMPRDITFENCKFLSDYEGYANPFTIVLYGSHWENTPNVVKEIKLRNCFITQGNDCAVHFMSGTECVVENNFFYGLGMEGYTALALGENTGNKVTGNYSNVPAVWSGNENNNVTGNENISYKR